MNKKLAAFVLIALGGAAAAQWPSSDPQAIKPFTSDGCSLFPDASVITGDDWCACCFEHDVAYWQGGTRAERRAADLDLRRCVEAKTGNKDLARIMFDGVRFGGSPYFYNWYRWGYGWGFDRKYRPLTGQELRQIESILDVQIPLVKPLACRSERAAPPEIENATRP